MVEPDNGGTQTSPPEEKKELSMEKRLVLAFILMGAVLFLAPYIFKGPPQPPAKQTSSAAPKSGPAQPAQPAPIQAAANTQAPAAPAPAGSIPVESAASEDLFTVDTAVYRVTLSNRGGVVRSWKLKNYTAGGKPLELVNTASNVDFPFALYFKNAPATNPNTALFKAAPQPNGFGIIYTFSDGHLVVQKKFLFTKSSYQTQISTEVTQDGKPLPHLIE